MSRLRRLKEQKIKNRIKATSCGLALALVMGSFQGLGTYALFTDTEDVASNLAISTGDVDVEIDKKNISHTDVQPTSELTHEFTISNHGTLNQNINLGLVSPTEGVDKDIYECIKSYKVEFVVGQDGNSVIAPIENLKSGVQPLKVKGETGNLFVLKPGQSIKAMVTITMEMTYDQQIKLSGQTLNMKLNVEAVQLDEKNIIDKGFCDIEEQSNILTMGTANIIVDGDGMKVAGNGQPSNQYIEVYPTKDFYPIPESIEFVSGTGLFNDAIVEYKNDGMFVIRAHIYDTNLKKYMFKDNFGLDKIVIKFVYTDITKVIEFDFKKPNNPGGNKHAEAKYKILNEYKTISSELEIVEPPKEEVEKPSEPEVVEPPKEEVEVPSEPEVVEPPKEETEVSAKPEVVEPPKVEETVVPSQPDVIAPSKEETEIQE